MSRRVVALAVDSAERADIERGVREGWLPTFARILKGGRSVLLRGPNTELPGSTWPSLITGTPPTEHGALFERQLRPGSHRMEHVTAADVARPPFWLFADRAGRITTLASIYAAPLLRPFRGTQVVGWGAYDPFTTKLSKPRIDPPEVERMLRSAAPDRRSGFLPHLPESEEDFRAYARRGLENVRQQAAGLRALMRRTEWDLFLGSFGEPHESGHVLWHFHDPEHGEHALGASPDLRDAVRNIYRAIDTELHTLLSMAPEDAVVLVYTPLGMGPHYRLDNAIDPVLVRSGLLKRGAGVAGAAEPRYRMAMAARRALHRVIPIRARRRLGRLMPFARRRLVAAMELADVDWSATRAFSIGSDGTSMVRVNLRGREPMGIVEPGDGYERLLDEITRLARSLVDAGTGEPVVEDVIRVDGMVNGRVTGSFPDLVLTYRREAARRLRSPAIGEIDVPTHDLRTGEHRDTGFAIASGPGVGASGAQELGEEVHSNVDMAPTILANLGVPPPDQLPGRPIPSFLRD